ncbi:unnamed protein product, partial [Polarella glacialis]
MRTGGSGGETNMIDADGDTEVAVVEKGQTPFTHEGVSLKDVFKPEVFGGEEKDYPDWIFSFEAYTSFLGLEDEMKEAARHTRPITTAELDEQHAKSAKILYLVLTQVLRDRDKRVSRAHGGSRSAHSVRNRVVRAFLIEEQKCVKQVLADKLSQVKKEKEPAGKKSKKDFGKMKVNVEKWVLHHTAYDSGGIPVPEHVVPTPTEVDVAAVTRAGRCYRCGGRGHIARDCPTEEEETNGGDGDRSMQKVSAGSDEKLQYKHTSEPQPTPELSAQVGAVYSAAAPGSGLSEEELYKTSDSSPCAAAAPVLRQRLVKRGLAALTGSFKGLAILKTPGSLRKDEQCTGAADKQAIDNFFVTQQWKFLLIGEKGTSMFFHKDGTAASSWQVQLVGRKRWTLCPNTETPLLDVNLDTYDPDYKRFPKFARALCGQVTVSPGELLYYPGYWWHHTLQLDTPAVSYTGAMVGVEAPRTDLTGNH